MDSLERLKRELIAQKQAIIDKGGKVTTNYTNPSPSEITAGIKTITHANLSNATATPEDVKLGKTFYSQDEQLKVGTHEDIDYSTVSATAEDVKINKTFYDKFGNFVTGSHMDADLPKATATPEDVKAGKTFFAGNINIKTGTHTDPDYAAATATDNDVAFGATYYAGDDKLKTGSYIKPILDNADAVEMDVSYGKTFYAGNNILKTGKYVKPDFSGTATESDVAKGKTFYGSDHVKRTGTHTDTDFSLANATADDVVLGKTFYSQNNELKTGTHTDAQLELATASEDDVAKGKTFFAGDKTIKTGTHQDTDFGLADASEDDVKLGKTFYATDNQLKTGTYVECDFALATASEDDVVSGKTFYAGDNTLKTGTHTETDFSLTTASENDVLLGKKFYNSSGELVEGSLQEGSSPGDSLTLKALVCPELVDDSVPIPYTYPDECTTVGRYAFYQKACSFEVTLSPNTKLIDTYALYSPNSAHPITVTNFDTLNQLTRVESYALKACKGVCLDNLPPNIDSCNTMSFSECCKNSTKIILPPALRYTAAGCFSNTTYYHLEEIDFNSCKVTQYSERFIEYLSFDKPIIIPEGVLALGTQFNSHGDSPYVEIPTTCALMASNAFGGSNETLDKTQRKYIYFKGEEPPAMQPTTLHSNYLETDFKIYVPDNAVEAYKASQSFTKFVNKIFPISQLAE